MDSFAIRKFTPLSYLLEKWNKAKEKFGDRRTLGWPRPKPTEGKWTYWGGGMWVNSPKDARLFETEGRAVGAAKRHRQRGYKEKIEVVKTKGDRVIGKSIKIASVNPYLNTPPTELARKVEGEKDPAKKKKMQEALSAWRTTVPGPFRNSAEGVLLGYYSNRVASEEYRECYHIIAGLRPGTIKEIAQQAGVKLMDLLSLFKNSKVVKLFSKLGWSFKKLYGLLKDGHKALKGLKQALMDYAKQSGITQWTARQLDSKRLRDIDEWLKKHPKTKRMAGIAVAGVLAYIWLNMTFVGNPAFDFDLSDLLAALGGSFSIADIFSGTQGALLLILFLTGSVGLTFPWPGPQKIQFTVAVLSTIAKKVGKRLRKADNGDISRDLLFIARSLEEIK
jgi:hypothetical protein